MKTYRVGTEEESWANEEKANGAEVAHYDSDPAVHPGPLK